MPNESEPNDLRTNANTMNVGETMTGKISAYNDVDGFKVIFPKRAWIKFELDIPADTDYRIRVYTNDNGNNDVAAEDIRLNYLGQMRQCSAYVSNTSDIYYIGISPNTSGKYNPNVNYTLRVFYAQNDSVTDTLNGYKSTYNTKYWNAGKSHSQLSSSDWGVTASQCAGSKIGEGCTSNKFGDAYQCAGFALFLAKIAFGDELYHSAITDLSHGSAYGEWKVYKNNVTDIKLKAGDIIRKGGHSAMILDASNENDVKVVECWGSEGCRIYYGNFNGSSVNKAMSTVLSGTIEYLLIAPLK